MLQVKKKTEDSKHSATEDFHVVGKILLKLIQQSQPNIESIIYFALFLNTEKETLRRWTFATLKSGALELVPAGLVTV